ncbi:MAG: flagellar hook-basal body protein [Clostridia bacterium]|nr:MAG: flagellar hook-basal body protein [Clostridia bacterium]
MFTGLYITSTGMVSQQIAQETISNNLANLTTDGYKRDVVAFQSFPEVLLSRLERNPVPLGGASWGQRVGGVVVDYSQGAPMETGRQLDLALDGPGFFTLQTPEGLQYTRSGSFLVNAQGHLISPQGYQVLGESGPLTLNSNEITITSDGRVISGGQIVDRLRLTGFTNSAAMTKVGQNLFLPPPGESGTTVTNARVMQGYLEQSNIDLATEVADAMTALRIYEAGQRVLLAHNQLLDRAVNQVGRLR